MHRPAPKASKNAAFIPRPEERRKSYHPPTHSLMVVLGCHALREARGNGSWSASGRKTQNARNEGIIVWGRAPP